MNLCQLHICFQTCFFGPYQFHITVDVSFHITANSNQFTNLHYFLTFFSLFVLCRHKTTQIQFDYEWCYAKDLPLSIPNLCFQQFICVYVWYPISYILCSVPTLHIAHIKFWHQFVKPVSKCLVWIGVLPGNA